MKFREYNNVRAMVLTTKDSMELENLIGRVGERHNIIDLQFSTDFVPDSFMGAHIKYHALLLVEC